MDHLGVDGGVDPGQSPAEMVQFLCKHLLAFLQLVQDVCSLRKQETGSTFTKVKDLNTLSTAVWGLWSLLLKLKS